MEPDQTHPGAEPSLGARAGSAANPILQAADQWLKMPVAAAFGGRSSTGAIFDQGSDGVSPSIVELPRGSVRSQAAAESALGALRSRPGSGAGADHRTIEARLLRAADSDAVGLLDRPLGDQAAEAFAGVEVGESELPLKLTHAPRAPAIGLTAPLHQVDLGTNPSSASGASIAAVADAALSQVTPSDRAGMSESAVGIGAAASRMSDRAELATAQVRSALSNVGDASLIEIRLDPPELGRVEIRMDVTDDTLRATVSADRTVTVEALRRNSESLLQALREAGFSSVDLSFGHFAEHRRRDSERREHGPATLPFEREGGVPKVAVDRDRTPFRPIPAVGVWNGSGGLDMTI